MANTPVWHDIFRYIKLMPDNIVLEADTYKDTLNIVRGSGVSFGSISTSTDTFEINVDYDISIPTATTKISLEDINGNLSEINLKAGRGVAIIRNNAQELEFESYAVTETDTLQTVTERNNITNNKIFVNDIEVGKISSSFTEDGFNSFSPGYDLIGDGTLNSPLKFSPAYKDSLSANYTETFSFAALGPGSLSYSANYVFDSGAATGSVTLEREDPNSPGTWAIMDTQSGNIAGVAYDIQGIYSELYNGNVNYRLTYSWTGNSGVATWYVQNTFEGGAYTPINNPQLKTDTDAKTVDINDLQFFQNNIRTTVSNTDIVLDPAGTGKVVALSNITAPIFTGDLTGDVTGNVISTNTSLTILDTSAATAIFTGNVTGDVSGNASTVTNGVYTTGSYADPSWITSLDAAKIVGSIQLSDITIDGDLRLFDNVISTSLSNSDIVLDPNGTGKVVSTSNITSPTFTGDLTGNVTGDVSGNAGTVTNGVYTTGSYADPSWITSLDGTKVINAVLTTGAYANPNWITSLDASKIIGSIALSDITVDGDIRIYDNVITTTLSNSNLELRANGTGIVNVSDGLTVTSTLTANSTVQLSPANAAVTISPTGTGSVTINPAAASTMNNVTITVPAGTASVAPFRMTSGTNLSAVAAGAMEYDGSVVTFTTNTTVGRAPIQQIIFTSGISASNGVTVVASTNYALFPAANDTITLPVGTYMVEASFRVDTSASVSNALSFTMLGAGSATCTFIGQAIAVQGSIGSNSLQTRIASAAANTITTAVATATQRVVYITGVLRVSVQGTLVPSVQFSGAAGAMTFYADNYMILSPLSSSNAVASTGGWG